MKGVTVMMKNLIGIMMIIRRGMKKMLRDCLKIQEIILQFKKR